MTKTIKVSIRVIAMFIGAILLSYIPILIPKFFGDWVCQGSGELIEKTCHYAKCDYGTYHNSTTHWGYQHFLFFFMGLCLMVIQIVDIVNLINKDKND